MGFPGKANPANLRPPFERGNKQPRASAAVLRAIAKCRNLSPEAVAYLAGVMRDEEEPTAYRIKACELILNKAIPPGLSGKSAVQLDPGPRAMRIEIVDPLKPDEVITINPQPVANGHDTDDGPIRLTFAADKDTSR